MPSLFTSLLLKDAVGKYSPDQPRDYHGRWSGGASPQYDKLRSKADRLSAKAIKLGNKAFRLEAPNKIHQAAEQANLAAWDAHEKALQHTERPKDRAHHEIWVDHSFFWGTGFSPRSATKECNTGRCNRG